ncbi:hypothetical protein FLP41_04115 [Paracoccus marcusii]|uniref:hypothetical protein n=1 Tax=Paracoccus marcusii TaxID=59779 RepID=UPI002ED20FA1|nr:hypothetical protein FLP41_04115 [Paracoccus marcusii]
MTLLIQTAVIGRFASSDTPVAALSTELEMTTRQLCIDYLKALNEGNLEDVRALFSEDAEVVSRSMGCEPPLISMPNFSMTRTGRKPPC